MRNHATDRTQIGSRRTAGGGAAIRLRTRWIVMSTIVALVMVTAPAFAGVPFGEPSSCNTVATDGWANSCWVSNNS